MKYCVTYEYWGSLENKYINIKTAAIKPLKGVIAAVFITYLVSINEYSYTILILFSIVITLIRMTLLGHMNPLLPYVHIHQK